MEAITDITGLILAGGAGRRVGNRDKGLIAWQGQPLIAHVIANLAPQVGEVLISCNRHSLLYQAFGARTVADRRSNFLGPLAGLEAAAAHVKTDLLVVVPCDMPLLPADLVSRLVEPLKNNANDAPEITYAHDGTRAQYLCAAMKRAAFTDLSEFLDEGNRAVKEWYRRRTTLAVDFSDQAACFSNFNRLA